MKNSRRNRILNNVFTVLWPLLMLRLGNWLLYADLFNGTSYPGQFLPGNAFYLSHFLFIGLVTLCVYWLFSQNYRGKRIFLLLLSLGYLFFLALPESFETMFPFLSNLSAWGFEYNATLVYIIFFSYVITLVKSVLKTVK